MRDFDETGLKLCRMQAEIFKESASKENCSSAIFIRRFMYSEVAHRMDLDGFLFEACDANRIFEEISEEFGKSAYGKEKYTEPELYWIGYIYRYWSFTHQKTSRQIYKIIKPKELRSLYFPYHSLDPAQAIERVEEAKGIGERNMTEKGVEIMRNILSKNEGGSSVNHLTSDNQ
ncbi:MAG: antitoxin [Clostridiales bacterium]|nr:antitoxin [Clostridiales bacterium]